MLEFTSEPPIKYFQSSGLPVYYFQNPETGHKYFDYCECEDCLYDSLCESEDTFSTHKRRRKKKSTHQILQERYEAGDPTVDFLGESSDYLVIYGDSPKSPKSKPIGCYMLPSSSSSSLWTEEDFPSLEFHNPQEKTIHHHQIPDTTTILPDGSTKGVSAAEAAVNWQAANSLAQNKILQQIAHSQQNLDVTVQKKLSSLELLIHDLQQKIQSVHQELLQMAYPNQTFSATFYEKDAEMKHLKVQLQSLQAQQHSQQHSLFDRFLPSPQQNLP